MRARTAHQNVPLPIPAPSARLGISSLRKRGRPIEIPGYFRFIFIAAAVGLLLILLREEKRRHRSIELVEREISRSRSQVRCGEMCAHCDEVGRGFRAKPAACAD
jgi:hypothetical protein